MNKYVAEFLAEMIRRGKNETYELVRDFADRWYNQHHSLFCQVVYEFLPKDDEEVNLMKKNFALIFQKNKPTEGGYYFNEDQTRLREYFNGWMDEQEGSEMIQNLVVAPFVGAGGDAVSG